MRYLKLILLCLALPMAVFADNWNESLYKQIEQSIVEPTFADRIFDITKYGASTKADAAKNQKRKKSLSQNLKNLLLIQ